MVLRQTYRAERGRSVVPVEDWALAASSGEIYYLWYFVQGSIMNPDVRLALRNAWGFCERHAWIAIQVEVALRQGYMMGPAILYEDLLERSAALFELGGPLKRWQLIKRLRGKGLCLMCEMNLGPETQGFARKDLMSKGRNPTALRKLSDVGRSYWEETVCGRCSGGGSWRRCRRHLIEDLTQGEWDDLDRHATFVRDVSERVARYSRSFEWGCRDTATDEDRASLISAVGWCSGWRPFLSMIGMGRR